MARLGRRQPVQAHIGRGGGYVSEVLKDGPVAYWRLGDRGAGLTAVDSSGNGSNLTYQSSVTDKSALINDSDHAADFSSDGQYADSTSVSPVLYGLSGSVITVETWVKFTSLTSIDTVSGSQDRNFFSRQGPSAHNDGIFWIYRNDTQSMILGWYNSGFNSNVFPASFITTKTLYHFVVTCDGSTASFYSNGSLVSSITQTGTPLLAASSNDLHRVGFSNHGSTGTGSQAGGTLDELAVYSKALSASRVAAHYTMGIAPPNSVNVPALEIQPALPFARMPMLVRSASW